MECQTNKLIHILLITCLTFSFVHAQVNTRCSLPRTRKPGVCKLVTQCPSAIEQKRKGIEPVLCGHYYNIDIVCCEERPSNIDGFPESEFIFPDVVRPPIPNRKRICEQKCQEYGKLLVQTVHAIALLPNPDPIPADVTKCDYNLIPLIVGGSPAEAGEFPHMALIGFEGDDGIDWNCGGTLISERYVVTAAHCVVTRLTPKVVRLGELNLARNDDAAPEDFGIDQIRPHPAYKAPRKYHDIALIRLSRIVQFNKFIRPACLWTKFDVKYNKTIATGWGRTFFAGTPSDKLLKVSLDVIDYNSCNDYYRENVDRILPRGIDRSMICAGVLEGEKDTCQGDSGGPIQITHKENQCLFYIIGITSFGKGCGAKNAPAIYTRISEHLDWIESIVWP